MIFTITKSNNVGQQNNGFILTFHEMNRDFWKNRRARIALAHRAAPVLMGVWRQVERDLLVRRQQIFRFLDAGNGR